MRRFLMATVALPVAIVLPATSTATTTMPVESVAAIPPLLPVCCHHHETADRVQQERRRRPPRHQAPAPIPMSYALASWYYDTTGQTACGYHAVYGVASRTLACGTHVTFSYHGRVVMATVDDRGPFVYDRLFDLNQNLAQALGFSGVDTVGYRIE